MTVTRPQRSGAAGIILIYIMEDDKVILELSLEDVERLDDLFFGFILIEDGSDKTDDCLHVNARLLIDKRYIASFDDLMNWINKMEDLVYSARVKAIADSTDPIIP